MPDRPPMLGAGNKFFPVNICKRIMMLGVPDSGKALPLMLHRMEAAGKESKAVQATFSTVSAIVEFRSSIFRLVGGTATITQTILKYYTCSRGFGISVPKAILAET